MYAGVNYEAITAVMDQFIPKYHYLKGFCTVNECKKIVLKDSKFFWKDNEVSKLN